MFRFVLELVQPYRKWLIVVFIAMLVETAMSIAAPWPLKIIIDNEDHKNPLNDDEIVLKLKDQGIDLARRTVAKYRKILNIPTARQRRDF